MFRALVIVLVIVLAVQVLAGYVVARRHGVSFRRVLRLQWGRFRRALTALVWLLMLLPPVNIAVRRAGGEDPAIDGGELLLVYGFCVGALWLLGAWPFGERSTHE